MVFNRIFSLLLGLAMLPIYVTAQTSDSFVNASENQSDAKDVEEKPVILYSGTPKRYEIAGITVSGSGTFDEKVLIGLSGLSVGQRISVPGTEITDAMKRFWKNGLFSNVRILASKIEGDKIYLELDLTQNPKVREIVYHGLKKGETNDIEEKIGLIKGSQITPNMLDRSELLIRRYYDEKGFKNAEVRVQQRNEVDEEGFVTVDVYIDKKDKIKVNAIYLTGNEAIESKTIKKMMKKTNEKGYLPDILRTKKFVDEEFIADKDRVLSFYNEKGYRDAYIKLDSVAPFDDKSVDIYLSLDEGDKYYIRNISWVGNTIYNSEALGEILNMRRGDVYNQKKIEERTSSDEDAVGNLYYNNGYLMYQLNPVEANVIGDSIDLELRISEGPQHTINRVNILGNERLYENVVRRELYTRPGDLFSKEALERSYRQIAQMGHFNPETIDPQIKPNFSDGTVDIDWNLESKANDQIEFSAGWGQTGVIGRMAVKFTNFSMYNLFHKSDNYRMFIPQGDGQTFSISGQTNGNYYQSYSLSFLEPWLGGKRPNSLQASLFFSKQTDVSTNYYNSSYYQNMYQYMYGYGNYGNYGNYNTYESYLDPDKYITMFGASLGIGKRLHWPDDYFTIYSELSYTRYKLKDWSYFLIQNGACNNINLSLTVGRDNTDNQLFPRMGSSFSLSVSATPPYSLFDNLDYANLASDNKSASYQKEMQDKHRWIEYHKWKFKSRTYTSLTGGKKCLVLMTRADAGLLGHYNKYKKSPFETFFMGGDGMSGSYNYATETIGLRGYDNGSLTPYGQEAYAYTRLTAELRYPLMMENSTTIYALAFLEGGNAWTDIKKFNPFDIKRSAGIGVRVFLPMVGLMGLDWGYGFDPVFGDKRYGGSQVHFILGQEF